MSDSPYSAPTSSLGQEREFALIDVAIGDNNTDYYIRYLEAAGERDWVPSWHWPAFLVTTAWLLYRKLWLAWFLYVFALPVAAILIGAGVGIVLGETFGALAQSVIMLGCYFVLMPMYANALYVRKLRRLMNMAAAHSDEREKRIQWLAKHGGTSLVWIAVFLIPVVLGIVAAVALPAYQDYIESSNMARVNAHYEEAVRYVENEMRKVQSEIALGEGTAVDFVAAHDSARWVADLNRTPGASQAPGGGSSYAIEADDGAGVVGVAATGAVTSDAITYQVTIVRPAYGSLSEQAAEVVRWTDI